jgi:hypothetical protein
MPYNPWVQFRKQRISVGLQAALPVLHREYPVRRLSHSQWHKHDAFNPADVVLFGFFPAWVHKVGGIYRIETLGAPAELLDGIRNYGGILEAMIGQVIRGTAGGAVIYDDTTDRLYYSASRWIPGLPVHRALLAKEGRLPIVQTPAGALNTLVPNRSPRVCAEFQALNQALLDGAREANLHLWSFRARSMEPFPQCPNCQVTVDRHALAKVWTC